MGFFINMIDDFRNCIGKRLTTPQKDALQSLDDMEAFYDGIDKINAQLTEYNKVLYEKNSGPYYKLREPNPDAGKNTSACYTDGYTLKTEAQMITLMPEFYKDGKFRAHITKYGNNNDYKKIEEEYAMYISIGELQNYIENMVKEDRASVIPHHDFRAPSQG